MVDFESQGFAIIEDVISGEECDEIASKLDGIDATETRGKPGLRDLFCRCPEIVRLAKSETIKQIVARVLGKHAFAVRAIYFDKTSATNWNVPWHQDTFIAVKEKHQLKGFEAWSTKDGVPHCQPPDEVLQQMLTVRLHLDRCDSDNGPLRIMPGSHRGGVLSQEAIKQQRAETTEKACVVGRGGCVVMSPLLLHASSKAVRPGRRRVIHLEFANVELPKPLEWYERI